VAPGMRLGFATGRSHTAAMPAKKRATVYLNADLYKALRVESAALDLTVSELVSAAVRAHLADASDEATFGKRAHAPTVSFRGVARGAKANKAKKAKKAKRRRA